MCPTVFFVTTLLLASAMLSCWQSSAQAFSKADRVAFQRSIIDWRKKLHPRFKEVRRKSTKFIIVHTSEAGLKGTLRAVSKGKTIRGRRITYGGHTHYVIARNGRTYRILGKQHRADHAGLSMWDGQTDISSISLGIELVGYHYTDITANQYRSVGILIDILQRVYDLDDGAVLTHSQIAYGRPNRWFKKDHRGRKRCAKNFNRAKAGLGPTWSHDPDVMAGRLTADPELATIYYAGGPLPADRVRSNVITTTNTAWDIAGEDYDSPTTLYRLPSGTTITGDQFGKQIGWNRVPKLTVVLLNQEKSPGEQSRGPIKTITNGFTAWDFAGLDYNKRSTFYFFPKGRIKNGKEISDWDELPAHTKMIVGYRGPFKVTSKRPPIKIAGMGFKNKETLYLFPNRKIVSGNDVKDFRKLPKGVMVFLPTRS
jgi:hypothetical protein